MMIGVMFASWSGHLWAPNRGPEVQLDERQALLAMVIWMVFLRVYIFVPTHPNNHSQ